MQEDRTNRPTRPVETTGLARPARATGATGGADRRRSLGHEGESRAAALLERRGYRIVARNVRAGGVEIDLVALRAGVVAFVEVKTRRGRDLGAPEDAVDARKRARLVRGAAAWLHENPRVARRARFDVVTCEAMPDGAWRIRHLEGAFDAGD
jgi:putative endonuclease